MQASKNQVGFYFDQTRCTGCMACRVVCKDWHDIPAGKENWMLVNYQENGIYPNLNASYMISPCYHCEEAVCSFVCPNEAISKREKDGIVVVDKEKCREEHVCGLISSEEMGPDFLYGESESPCQAACPAHLRIPGYVALIAKGKFKEALELIRRNMPLPSVCGQVCLHPCEAVCSRKDLDKPIAIEALKGFVVEHANQGLPKQLPQTQKSKVAIVGSGPAGLSAAYELIKMGYGVTIFEALSVAGGMLSVGVPKFRLPGNVLGRDIDYIKALGVEIKTNSPIDLDNGVDKLLKDGYGAVLLAVGAHKGQKLKIPGADLEDVWVGTSFMKAVNLEKEIKIGQKVIVIGGGNVAIDCARSARRLGAAEVTVSCLECCEDMPADPSEVEQAREEGIEFMDSRTFTSIEGKAGKISGVSCLEITGCTFDEKGPHFTVVDASEHILTADTVIFAIGQSPDLGKSKIKIDRVGTIVADSETMMLDRSGVFVAGDCFSGVASIIDAIAGGQKTASVINRYLQGDVLRVRPKLKALAGEIVVKIPADAKKVDRLVIPLVPAAERISNFNAVEKVFSSETAIAEAERCLNCAGHLCKDVCPYSAPQFVDVAAEKTRMQKCNYCVDRIDLGKQPVCIESCYARALDSGTLEELKEKYGEINTAAGFVNSETAKPSIVFKPKTK